MYTIIAALACAFFCQSSICANLNAKSVTTLERLKRQIYLTCEPTYFSQSNVPIVQYFTLSNIQTLQQNGQTLLPAQPLSTVRTSPVQFLQQIQSPSTFSALALVNPMSQSDLTSFRGSHRRRHSRRGKRKHCQYCVDIKDLEERGIYLCDESRSKKSKKLPVIEVPSKEVVLSKKSSQKQDE